MLSPRQETQVLPAMQTIAPPLRPRGERGISMRKSRYVYAGFPFSFFHSVAPSSSRRSNSWKSGKVCESRRFTTMGVKVGGVETVRSLTGAWISRSMDQGPVTRSLLLRKKTFEKTAPVKLTVKHMRIHFCLF